MGDADVSESSRSLVQGTPSLSSFHMLGNLRHRHVTFTLESMVGLNLEPSCLTSTADIYQ